MFEMFKYETKRNSLPRKISEFREMYRKDIEEIIEPNGFVYEDRDEYYGTEVQSSKEKRKFEDLYYKNMPYGKMYLSITATGRMGEFRIDANVYPAIQELANIEKHIYGTKGIKNTSNILQWHEGHPGVLGGYSLVSGTNIVRDKERYGLILNQIKEKLINFVTFLPAQFFEANLKESPRFYTVELFSPRFYRIGYWLIMAKLADEQIYLELLDKYKYIEANKQEIQEKYNVDITKLKEFLDTYIVGSLA